MKPIKQILITAIFFALLATIAGAQTRIDGKWKLIGYSFSEKKSFPVKNMDVTLNVTSGKKVAGRSGCNMYGGTLGLQKGNRLAVTRLTSTDMACDEMHGSFESLFMQVLSQATQYSVKSGRLTITDPTTKQFLRFQKVR